MHRAHTKVYNSLYIRPAALLAEPIDPTLAGFIALACTVMGAKPGQLYRYRVEELYGASVEKLCSFASNHSVMADAEIHRRAERQQLQISQAFLHIVRTLCPHSFRLPGTRLNDQRLDEFREEQNRTGVGNAAIFYSYSEGSTLYFSDETEAVMARLVFAPETDH